VHSDSPDPIAYRGLGKEPGSKAPRIVEQDALQIGNYQLNIDTTVLTSERLLDSMPLLERPASLAARRQISATCLLLYLWARDAQAR